MVERELAGDTPLFVRSLYGSATREPYVELQLGDQRAQLPVVQARMVASWLGEAIEASIQDAFLVEWMQSQFELEIAQAALILREYRTWREKRFSG